MQENSFKITTIIFDVGNVILHYDYLRGVRRLAQATGLSEEKTEKEFCRSERVERYVTGKLTSRDFFEGAKRDLGLSIGFDEFSRIWNDIFWPNHFIEEMIAAVKGKYRLAALSNTNDLHYRYWIEKFPILNRLDFIFVSHEMGLRKPDPEIFREALRKLGAEPEETVFIDDMEENVQTALSLGIAAVRFQSPEQLKKELAELGVEIPFQKNPS
ncbi:MAG TPA: HAD family phosphatase [Candidatus Omnitrophota bacterium]|nr:HAD family phosphatase [Candidatus Omnitrophota bacterium]